MEPTTPAATALTAIMREENWNKSDLAIATGMSYKTVLRWLDGSANPPKQRVADLLSKMGRDPSAYGISAPRPPQTPALESPPAWFLQFMETQLAPIHEKLDIIIDRQRKANAR